MLRPLALVLALRPLAPAFPGNHHIARSPHELPALPLPPLAALLLGEAGREPSSSVPALVGETHRRYAEYPTRPWREGQRVGTSGDGGRTLPCGHAPPVVRFVLARGNYRAYCTVCANKFSEGAIPEEMRAALEEGRRRRTS